jgi:hypothetical protein
VAPAPRGGPPHDDARRQRAIPFGERQGRPQLVADLARTDEIGRPAATRPFAFGDEDEELPVVVATDDLDEETASGQLLHRAQRRQVIRLEWDAPR